MVGITRESQGLPGFSICEVRYRANQRQPRHHHTQTSATLILAGSLEEVVGSSHERAAPLSVVFKPAGTEHANRIGPQGANTVQVTFEADLLPGSGMDVAEAGWGWTHGGPAAHRFVAFFASWRRAHEDATGLEARLYDLLSEIWDCGPLLRGSPPSWLLSVVEELEDTFRAPRRVRQLADDAGVHPVALARAHRRHFRCSISDRVRARRVGAAAAMLADAGMGLSSVAFRLGFSDQSHLTRVFKSETGVTPGRYRKLISA